MNYCPNCGTANRDGSRFCNECGHKLPSKTGIVCPMCSHMNPAANVYCDNCQARLVPAAPGSPPAPGVAAAPPGSGAPPIKKGLSLPTKSTDAPEPEPERDETPDWLARLRAAAPRPSETAPPPAEPASPPGEMPEWMRPAEGEAPDWFQRLSEPSPTEPSPQVGEDALPDWMQGIDLGPGRQPPEGKPAGASAPTEGTPPSAPGAPDTGVPPEAGDYLASERGELDWLAQPAGEAADSDLPDWLKELESEAEPPAPPVEAMPPAPAPTSEEPDWLADLRTESQIEPSTQEPFDRIRAGSASEESDWLAGLLEQPAAVRRPEAGETTAEEMPDWLAALRDQTQPEVTGEETGVEQPDWLTATGEQTPTEEAEGPVEAPDWLRQLAASAAEAPAAEPAVEEPSTQAEVPDWLVGLTAAPEVSEAAQEAEPAPASDEAPDWSREIGAGLPEPVEAASSRLTADVSPPAPSSGVSAFIGEDIELADQTQVPDWLTDVAQPSPPEAAEEPAPVEVPDWLRELGPASHQKMGTTSPPGEARPEETPFGETVPAGQGDVPEWLREMQPGQAPPAFADETGRTLAPADAGLEAAAIPVWLQALRPPETPGAAAMPEEEVVETEGLLAGLRHVLPAAPYMGQSYGKPADRQVDIPAADLARAGLFQELLARGSLAPTVVRPRPVVQARMRARLSRWFIAIAIFVAAFTPNVSDFLAGIVQLGSASAELYQPAAERIAALTAGDRVLLAFDYEAFQAGEMDAIAQALLTHIWQRGADAIVVSLNPTGPALAERVLTKLKDGDWPDAAFVQRSYLPGQAVGAQSALIAAQADLVVVLAGSPEAMRVWVEQASAAGLPPPIVAGVSAGALPQVRPYVQSGQVTEPVTGLIGALAYQRSLDPNQDAGNAAFNRTVQSEALYLSQLTFAVILIAGLLVSLAAGTRRAG